MVGGQYVDVAGAPATPTDLRRLHELKTGRLIAASVECVLLLAGASTTCDDRLPRASRPSSACSSRSSTTSSTSPAATSALGKPQGSDERHGKRTYVSEFGLDGARELAARVATRKAASRARRGGAATGAAELEQITDFIFTRTS